MKISVITAVYNNQNTIKDARESVLSQTQEIQSSFAPYRIYNTGNNEPVSLMGFIENFNYKPDTKLEDGIREFIEWYRGFYR